MRFKLPLCALSLISLTACTTLKLPPAKTNFQQERWTQRRAALQQITHWDIMGALSVQYNQQPTIASYTWQQDGSNYKIQLQSSLNLYSLKIAGQPGRVTLWEAHKKTIQANSAEKLLERRVGWSLPVSHLPYWIRGLPAPGAQTKQFDRYGHLTQIQQAGWQVEFSDYVNLQQKDLPRTLNIQGHDLKIRIVIKQWHVT